MEKEEVRFFDLNTGAKIPSIGLGTYAIPPHIVAEAIKLGYRHIDGAHIYGNEKQVGDVLKQLFEDGVVKREELFITSKLGNFNHDPEDVPKALDRTLRDLQLDYLDLYLIHWPIKAKKGSPGTSPEDFLPADIPTTWKAMEALYDSGRVRAIGVSNFSRKKLNDLLEVARIPPAVNQVECHPMWQQPKLRELCRLKGIHLSGYSPLGSQFAKIPLLADPVINTVAEKVCKSPAQVALRWGLQMGHSVLPSTFLIGPYLKICSPNFPKFSSKKLSMWCIQNMLGTKLFKISGMAKFNRSSLMLNRSASLTNRINITSSVIAICCFIYFFNTLVMYSIHKCCTWAYRRGTK